jgi:zinc D-Ala-D-Ala carboxypeptidase
LAICVLQPLRYELGATIHVNSGFRSEAVNKAVKGSLTSSHCKGEAADLSCYDNARLFGIIKEQLPFDQLIWEGGDDDQPAWVHVSYRKTGNRQQILRMINGKYQIMS